MAQLGRSAVLSRRGIDIRRLVIAAIVALFMIAAIVALLFVSGHTSAPFDVRGEVVIGRVDNSVGDRYAMSAARLTSTWTLNRDAEIVLRVGGGAVTVDGRDVAPGCYSGNALAGTVISFADATDVSFASPDTDSSCSALP